MVGRAVVVAAVVIALAGCQAGEDADPAAPTPPATPAPAQGPADPDADGVDPCAVLDEQQVSAVVGQDVDEAGISGGEVFRLCTYQLADGVNTVDVALVDLERLAQVDEPMDGDAYIASLGEGAGTGIVAEIDAGDGDAITIVYEGGAQAWAWTDDLVVGAYADALADNTAAAVDLLEAALAEMERP